MGFCPFENAKDGAGEGRNGHNAAAASIILGMLECQNHLDWSRTRRSRHLIVYMAHRCSPWSVLRVDGYPSKLRLGCSVRIRVVSINCELYGSPVP
jgi:hypothetical protein